MRKVYDGIDPEWYEARHERMPREGYLRDHWRPLITTAIIKYCKGKMTLDLGCGGGAYTRLIREYTDCVLGMDISRVMLSYAKDKYSSLSLALADTHHIPLKAESMDTIVSIGLFEYVERAVVLEEINRVLRPKGTCIIVCPNKYSAARMPAKVICQILGREYFCKEPSSKEMLGLFQANGFEVIESKMDDGLVWLPGLLDQLVGERIYTLIEKLLRIFGRNPFSNAMLFVGRKEKS